MTYFETKIKEWSKFLEQNTLNEVLIYLEDLGKRAKTDYYLFFYLVNTEVLLQEIYQHRVKLAIIVSDSVKMEILAEDRSRIVFLLAKCVGVDFLKANEMFTEEFGPGFQLRENYLVGSRRLSWKDLAIKARSIKRGIYNICCLQIQETVDEIIAYYKIFKVTNQDEVLKILNLAQDIRDELESTPLISTNTETSKAMVVKAKELFHATGRLKMDEDKLDENPDFLEIQEYAFYISFVCIARSAAITQKADLDDSKFARKFLMRVLGQTRFIGLEDTAELLRLHKPLTPIQK